jgi:hypothetical protein
MLEQKTQRLIALKGMANNLPPESLAQLLDGLLDCIADGLLDRGVLSKLKRESIVKVKQDQPFLYKEFQRIDSIFEPAEKAEQLHQLLPHLPLAILPLRRWAFILHLLAHRKRANLMQDLITLVPAIIHLGGKDSLKGILDATQEVCRQWP